jgi:hypothetical protein
VKASLAAVAAMVALMVAGMTSAPIIQAQQPISTVAFEAASVKPNNSTDFRGSDWNFLPGGRFVASDTHTFYHHRAGLQRSYVYGIPSSVRRTSVDPVGEV